MEKMIRYSEKIRETELLGPGKRAVLWVHGCCFDCPGCIAQKFRHGSFQTAPAQELAQWFLECETDDLTISGGEPMLQAEALSEMIAQIRNKKDAGVIVYSGFVYEELLKKAKTEPGIKRLLEQTDILIDGPYLEELNENQPYRGSANQRVLLLSQRYKKTAEEYYFHSSGRKVEVRLSAKKTLMVGVPGKEQAAVWQKMMELSGNGEQKESTKA